MSSPLGNRTVVAALALALLIGGVYAVVSAGGSDTSASAEEQRPAATKSELTPTGARLLESSLLVRFVETGIPEADGRLVELPSTAAADPALGGVSCRRVHATREDGPTICIRVSRNGFDYEAVVLDGDRGQLARVPVDGVPSRARVSRDGRYAAYTSFVDEGEGYFASTSEFSTKTRIIDVRTGKPVLRLEQLEVRRGGRRVPQDTAELWGVTFGDAGHYLATMAVGKEHLLIEGRVGSGRAQVIGENVECPSLSPDGRRIAYKRRIGNSNRWRLHVRRVHGGGDVALAEQRSIDDQPEWIGDDRIAYSDGNDVYAVPADGSGAPELVVRRAASPAALSPP